MIAAMHAIAWRRGLPVCLLVPWAAVAIASQSAGPAATAPALEAGLKQVGRGHLSWFGLAIYEASLWSADGRWSGFEPGRPVALTLAYERSFSRAELVRITTGEFARLGLADPDARARWSERLGTLWHDVAPGSSMTAVVVPGGATRFYCSERLLGTIDDPAFGPAYLSIWLDPRSALRDLRTQLLGLGPH